MDPIVKGVLMSIIILLFTGFIFNYWKKKKFKSALLITLFFGLILRVVGASSPYLHEWDERYHALVAKNLIEHPLTPTLQENPVLEYDNQNWVGSNIWLAKPALPLWLMSGSIAIFGNELFAVRLPSIVLGLLAIWLTFLIARRLFGEKTAVIASFFHAIHGLTIELIGGGVSSDHVENTFIVMVQLAIYFIVLQRKNINLQNTILAGLFMGLAFMSKWYPALIVLPVGFVLLLGVHEIKFRQLILHLLLLSGIAVIVAFPWTYYMYDMHPKEMGAILSGALSAYSNTVPSHDQVWYYYLNKLLVLFGEVFYLILGYAVYRLWKEKGSQKYDLLSLVLWIGIPLLIFSFAETKRFTYLLIASPATFILIAYFFVSIYNQNHTSKNLRYLRIFLLVLLPALALRYTSERMKLFKTPVIPKAVCYQMPDLEWEKLDENTIVFGTDDYVEIMFHTDVYAAYRKVPTLHTIDSLKNEGFKVLIYKELTFQ